LFISLSTPELMTIITLGQEFKLWRSPLYRLL